MIAFIVMSSVAYLVNSLERYHSDKDYPFFDDLDLMCFIIFSIEYVGRIISAPSRDIPFHDETWRSYIAGRMEFALRIGNLIDFLSVFPFFVNLILLASGSGSSGNAGAIARIVRIFRLKKVLNMKRFQSELEVHPHPSLIDSFCSDHTPGC